MSNVIKFPLGESIPESAEHYDARRVIDAALENEPEHILILAWTKDGDEYYVSNMKNSDILWLLERAKKVLLDD